MVHIWYYNIVTLQYQTRVLLFAEECNHDCLLLYNPLLVNMLCTPLVSRLVDVTDSSRF